MNNLEKQLNKLFKDYPHTPKVMEFKDEMLTNLEAKVVDLVANGVPESEAINQAINDAKGFEIEDIQNFSLLGYKVETAQLAFIYSLVGLILTIPLMVYSFGRTLNFGMIAITLGLGVRYYGFKSSVKNDCRIIIDTKKMIKAKKLIWLLWGVLFGVMVLSATAIQFGSNLWFGTPIKIDGPYALGALLARYYIPLVTILIPLYFNSLIKLIENYQEGETNEY